MKNAELALFHYRSFSRVLTAAAGSGGVAAVVCWLFLPALTVAAALVCALAGAAVRLSFRADRLEAFLDGDAQNRLNVT